MKLRVGDTVQVISGKDRGKRGKVERLFIKEGSAAVEKVSRWKKHIKPTRKYPQGGIIEISRSVPTSNIMIVCPHCGKLTRVGIRIVGDHKLRICKQCGKSLDEENKR